MRVYHLRTRLTLPQNNPKEPDQALEESPEEVNQVSYELTVSEDKLKACVFAKVQGEVAITTGDVKAFLKEQAVSYGLVDDGEIEKYITEGAILREPCLMAEGMPSQLGRTPRLFFSLIEIPLKLERSGTETPSTSKIEGIFRR
jgi:uncharacterized protein (DUF342 family)